MFQEVGLYDLKINGRWCPICNSVDCIENSYRTLRAFDETMQELQEYVEFGVYDGVSSIDSEEEREIEKHVLNFYRERVYLRLLWAHKNSLF